MNSCETFRIRMARLLSVFLVVMVGTFSFLSAKAYVQISGIPEYAQRRGFKIPLDVNPRGVWIDTTDNGAYVDCGMVCLCMVESYFAGYGSEDEYVYYRTFAARNPNVPWASLTGDTFVESVPYPITGYVRYGAMSPEAVLAQLNAGNPVMIHRWDPSPHWVIIYGYDGPADYVNWGSFKIMSPTCGNGVLYQHLSDFISNYYGQLNDFMYRTSGFLPNKRTPVDLGDSFLAKIYLVEGNMAIGAVGSGNIELDTDADIAGQDWRFDRTGKGSYIITNLRDGRVMDLANGGTGNGTNISLCTRWADSDPTQVYQRWYIYENGDGYYRLSPEASPSRSLDAAGGYTTDGTNIQLWDANDTIAQRLRFHMFGGEILKGISCSETELELRQGQTEQLNVTYQPWQAVPLNKRGVAWRSSDEAVATVDSTGLVTARGEGTCTITVISTYNDLFSANCTVTVKSGLEIPEITDLTVSGRVVSLSWSESPLLDGNDERAYEVFVYPKGNIDDYVWADWDVDGTSCVITLEEHGEYTAYVRAVNKTDNSRSEFDSKSFMILDDEWMYLDELPDNLQDVEVQYLNHYNPIEQAESPGEGWTRGESKTTYVNGNVLYSESPNRLQESDTLVYLGTFYYHYCDGSSAVEYFWTSRFCNHTRMDNNGQFDIVWQGPDEANPSITVYRLRWNQGQWAGGLASCAYGSSSPMSLYYMGHRYQERTAVTTYVWTKDTEWGDTVDPNADSVSYRIREVTYENRLNLPAGTERIEAEAFMNNVAIQEVVVPHGCSYIGNRAFAGCTELRRVYIPVDTVVETDAFDGCPQVRIIRTGK